MKAKHFVLSIITVTLLMGQAEKKTTAVLDFDGLGIEASESIALTQRLAGEMVNTNAFILVDRSQMEEILEEQGFQQTGCTTSECAVEIGNLLGVQQMVSGSFGKIGKTYTIETKLFSVETGETIQAVNKTYKGEVDELITQVELVAWELAGLEPPDALKKKAGLSIKKQKVVSSGKGKKWLIRGLTTAAVGAGVAYAISQKGETPSTEELGEPPSPPQSPRIWMGGRK
ncbi:MAG: hypothetical protein ISR83_00035 [Candidatus Marinimicrobia bacterium]|nr:hypothetical protein [Candidatus Neomarinimicrobiota bacterium]